MNDFTDERDEDVDVIVVTGSDNDRSPRKSDTDHDELRKTHALEGYLMEVESFRLEERVAFFENVIEEASRAQEETVSEVTALSVEEQAKAIEDEARAFEDAVTEHFSEKTTDPENSDTSSTEEQAKILEENAEDYQKHIKHQAEELEKKQKEAAKASVKKGAGKTATKRASRSKK